MDSGCDIHEWHLWIDEEPRPGWANMAIDLALLDGAEAQGECWLRLYHWQPHCLSFGRHEPATRRYHVEWIQELGLDTVRRPTGGRAVWHGHELTYAVAAPSRRLGALHPAYLEIHGMLRDAVRLLGAPATLAPAGPSASLEAGPCFSQPAGGEVVIEGKKVIGSAQLRRETALLQHGSILLDDNQRMVLELVRGRESDARTAASLGPKPAVRSVPGICPARAVSRREMAGAVARSARSRWRGAWELAPNPDHILHAAARHFPRFQSAAWTWAR